MVQIKPADGIDLVIPWVDGSDPAWREARSRCAGNDHAFREAMYRDWGLMRYWFRGVEQNAPWVRKIHFITWGHLPPWLDQSHPKLHIVNHRDYLPDKYLPVFSSIPLELNLHRIEGLSKQFIFTNDDVFFLDRLSPDEYFRGGLPCDCLSVEPMTEKCTSDFGRILWNVMAAINEHFAPAECAALHPEKWFAPAYTEAVLHNNREACRWKHFAGFGFDHSANPLTRSTYEEVWKHERVRLEVTSRSHFRSHTDVTAWLMRYWQLATGEFVPYMQQGRRGIAIGAPQSELRDAILSAQTRVLCLNEGAETFDFAARAAYVRSLFERRLPEMSSFEKY